MPPAPDDDEGPHSGPFCVIWVYRDAPEAFERAARFALASCGYGLEVVMVFTESGARLLQTDRMASLFRVQAIGDLIETLIEKRVHFELDVGAARRVGVVETLGSTLPNLRIADEQRLAELTTGARMTARY